MPAFAHAPVLLETTVELLSAVPDGVLADLTLGGGGHAAAVLEAHPGLRLLGIDQDRDALAAAAQRLAPFADRVELVHARSDRLRAVMAERGIDRLSAALADLGVSSYQLDRADRGFSYRSELDGPLDMRMDASAGATAADVVNTASVEELARILREYGDERYARRIADALVAARPVTTTAELAGLVAAAIPAPARRRGGNPAKRSFQALRVFVNNEMGVLEATLGQMIDAIVPGGRAVVISYQSHEDRLVKSAFMRAEDGGCTCPPGLPCVCGAVPQARLLRRGAWRPSAEEVAQNRRAESARLRAIEILQPNLKVEVP